MSIIGRAALAYRNFQIHRRILSSGMKSQFIPFEGIRFHMYAHENGKPPLFLLHGFLDSSKTFRKLFPELIRKFDVYAIDLPGFGSTRMPEVRELWRIDSIARQTARFILHILKQRPPQAPQRTNKVDQSPQILTHSMGGLIAMHAVEYLQDHDLEVPFKRMHFVAPGALRFSESDRDAHRKRFYPTSTDEIRELLGELFHETRTDLPDFLLRGLLEQWSHKGYEYLAENTIEEEDSVFYPSGKRIKLSPEIILYWGREDRIVNLQYGKLVRMTLRCRLIEMQGGHCVQTENPDELMRAFLANCK
ncbi:MAG TPA: alpha/beta fold hydrolase [Leptospiraceae bacterium]|nr:alpha/beta fold hydrolase [Leptospiraceae bacterium]HNJ04352.1 alpha/beta fold hydrolase [Leptospiraceae bacterium]HNL68385.1 alpha/beta fold hydrolase [Leptospiraceae bacterium]HNN73749.1 alpha/beta fold hydrolase [Leptospiraceae bacterium]